MNSDNYKNSSYSQASVSIEKGEDIDMVGYSQDSTQVVETDFEMCLQEIKNMLESMEQKFSKRLFTIEKGIEGMVMAFEGHVNESINFRNEIKNAFKLTAKKIFESETADYKLNLPCSTAQQVGELEKLIRDDKCAHKELRQRLFDIGSKDMPSFIRRSLELVWTNESAVNFSWSGQRLNIAVKDYKIILIIKDVARVRFKVTADQNELMDKAFKKWFFYAAQRISKLSHLPSQNTEYRKTLKETITNFVTPKTTEDTLENEKMDDKFINEQQTDSSDYFEINVEDEDGYEIEQLDEDGPVDVEIPEYKPANTFESAYIRNLKTLSKDVPQISTSNNCSKIEIKLLPTTTNPTEAPKHPALTAKQQSSLEIFPKVKSIVKNFNNLINMSTLLPIKDEQNLQAVEKFLLDRNNRTDMLQNLYQMKKNCPEININFNKIFTDSFLKEYSWNGKNNRKSLEDLRISKLMIDAWKSPSQMLPDFEKKLRACVFRSHSRALKQRMESKTEKL